MKRFLLAAAALPLLFAIGCGSGGGSGQVSAATSTSGGGSGPGSGANAGLVVTITDAPFPYDDVKAARVTISRIDIAPVGGGFTTLATFPGGVTVDLLDLQNGATAELVAANPPPGDYERIRLVVDHADVELKRNAANRPTVFSDLKVPSGDRTGIKLRVDPPISVVTQLTAELVIDFDLSRSFVFNGNIDRGGVRSVIFKPTLRAVNGSTAGRVTGKVLTDNATAGDAGDDYALAGATLKLEQGGQVVASGGTASDGTFTIIAVPAGTYDLRIEAFGHAPDLTSVDVVAANLTDRGTVTLEASIAEIEGVVTARVPASAVGAGSADHVAPLEGAAVTATPAGSTVAAAQDTTDASGNYVLSLAPGSFDVTAAKAGYSTATESGARATFAGKVIDFKLDAEAATASGTVADSTGAPVGGAVVTVSLEATGDVYATATTDASGEFHVTGLWTGRYLFETAAGGKTASVAADVVGTTTGMAIALP